MKEKILKVGVCEGRHPLPVNYYIFPQEINPLEVEELETTSSFRLIEIAIQEGLEVIHTSIILNNQVGYNDIMVRVFDAELHIYATGLTVAVLAVVKAAKKLFKSVVVMHYDRDSGNYYEQKM